MVAHDEIQLTCYCETGGFPVEAASILREEIATPSKYEGTPPKNGGSR